MIKRTKYALLLAAALASMLTFTACKKNPDESEATVSPAAPASPDNMLPTTPPEPTGDIMPDISPENSPMAQ